MFLDKIKNIKWKKLSEEEIEQILFEGLIMEERDEIKEIFEDDVFAAFMNLIWDSDENLLTYDKRLPNASIILNNKLVELVNYYRSKNFSFYEDIKKESLASLMLRNLSTEYDESKTALMRAKSYAEMLNNLSKNAKGKEDELGDIFDKMDDEELPDDPEEFDKEEENSKIKFLKKLYYGIGKYFTNMFNYQKITDTEIFKFDIENDIISIILSEFYASEDKESYIEKMKKYISDLEKLRFN